MGIEWSKWTSIRDGHSAKLSPRPMPMPTPVPMPIPIPIPPLKDSVRLAPPVAYRARSVDRAFDDARRSIASSPGPRRTGRRGGDIRVPCTSGFGRWAPARASAALCCRSRIAIDRRDCPDFGYAFVAPLCRSEAEAFFFLSPPAIFPTFCFCFRLALAFGARAFCC